MIKDGKFAVNPQFEWTGGGLAVTATDLARWAQLLYEGKVIDASLMDDLLDGVPAKLGPETKYGLGVIIRPTQHGVTYGHSGFMPGYQTDVMYFPELKASIAVQVNSSAPRSTGRPLRGFLPTSRQIVAGSSPTRRLDPCAERSKRTQSHFAHVRRGTVHDHRSFCQNRCGDRSDLVVRLNGAAHTNAVLAKSLRFHD